MARWLSWLERRPVTAEVTGSSPVWVVYGILAQLGEHLPYKQRVTGSSPVGPIDAKASCRRGGTGRRAGLKILWWRHRTGSIPVAGINFLKKLIEYVCVAQLDRALGYGPRCRGFESSHARPKKYRKPLIYKGLRYFFALQGSCFVPSCSISKFAERKLFN